MLSLSLWFKRSTVVKCLKISQNVGVGYQTFDLFILLQLVCIIVVTCYVILCFYHGYQSVVVKREHTIKPFVTTGHQPWWNPSANRGKMFFLQQWLPLAKKSCASSDSQVPLSWKTERNSPVPQLLNIVVNWEYKLSSSLLFIPKSIDKYSQQTI